MQNYHYQEDVLLLYCCWNNTNNGKLLKY